MHAGATLLALGLALVPPRIAPAQTTLQAELSGSNVTPGPGMNGLVAVATLTITEESATVTIAPMNAIGALPILRSPGTSSIEPMVVRLHEGSAGAVGRLLVELPWTPATAGDSVTVTGPRLLPFAERIGANPEAHYLEICTEGFPGGAARGPLRRSSPSPRFGGGPGPGIGAHDSPGRRKNGTLRHDPGVVPSGPPPPPPPKLMTWEFFFRRSVPEDARAAGLLPTELPVLRQLAADCVEQLDESDPLPSEERSRILREQVGRLRSQLGEAAFTSLEAYLHRRFEEDGGGLGTKSRPSSSLRAAQELRFPPLPFKVHRDPGFRLGATATSGLRVYFTASGDCSVRGSTVQLLSAGNCWITAHQPGNGEYAPAPEVTRILRIAKAEQRISGPPIPPKTYLEPDFPLVATATSGLPVVFQATGNCSVSLGTVRLLGAGSCYVTAHQPGDSNFTAAPIVDQEFPIAKADQTIELPAWESPPYGPEDLPLDPRSSSGLRVTVHVTGPCAFTGSHLRILRTGSCTVVADQPGNDDFNPAPPAVRIVEVIASSAVLAAAGEDTRRRTGGWAVTRTH